MTSLQSSSPLFTVEQLELIRRLKNSGINKDEIVSAFDSFEKIDKEIGPIYNIPVALALQAQALQLMAFSLTNNSTVSCSLSQTISPSINLSRSFQSQTQTSTSPLKNVAQTIDNNISHEDVKKKTNDLLLIQDKSDMIYDPDVDSQEFLNFLNQGELLCCEEIRAFAVKHNIKQQQIATLAGICQSYVSRYMKGDIYDMSERSRRAIQKWYLLYRNNPASIGFAANAAQHLLNSTSSSTTVSRKFIHPSSIDSLDLSSPDTSFPRRERFVFRPSHLEILEKYFQENNYPTYDTREEIALACNTVTESAAGRELTEREKVTAQIISNWFANKRKELKKLAKEEGLLDISLTRPRGHPSRLYSDLALIQQNRHNESTNNIVTSSDMQSPDNSSHYLLNNNASNIKHDYTDTISDSELNLTLPPITDT